MTFSSDVRNASVCLRGFSIGYNDKDHHIKWLEIDVDKTGVSGPTVSFAADFLLRDNSGRIDDRFSGWVEVLVIADTR